MEHRSRDSGFRSAGAILREIRGDLVVSKQSLRRSEAVACVRLKRQEANQNLGFASRPFVLCGLPIKRPEPGQLLHERRNGQFLLQVTGHPAYGLPWGQDRLVPIFLATLAIKQQSRVIRFRSAAQMLDTFGMQQGGTQYRRLVAAFQRIFGATIFFGTDTQRERAAVIHRARFNFMSEARIWYARRSAQGILAGEFQNEIVLSEEFFREIMDHPIPTATWRRRRRSPARRRRSTSSPGFRTAACEGPRMRSPVWETRTSESARKLRLRSTAKIS